MFEIETWFYKIDGEDGFWSVELGASVPVLPKGWYESAAAAKAAGVAEDDLPVTRIATRVSSRFLLRDRLVRAGLAGKAPPLPSAAEQIAGLARVDRRAAERAGFTARELAGSDPVSDQDPRLAAAASAMGVLRETPPRAPEAPGKPPR